MTISRARVERWLEQWARAIRQTDYDTARNMFAPDVAAFGSLAGTLRGLDQLVSDQWMAIWPKTRGFAFETPLLIDATTELAVVAVEWRSEGTGSGPAYARAGRATLVLRETAGGLVCVHSHFSMAPGTPALRQGSGSPTLTSPPPGRSTD